MGVGPLLKLLLPSTCAAKTPTLKLYSSFSLLFSAVDVVDLSYSLVENSLQVSYNSMLEMATRRRAAKIEMTASTWV